MTTAKLYRPLIFCLALLLAMAAVFSTQLLTGFGHVTGDRLDGLIQTSIFEHWFNVLRGRASWDTTAYFYPYRGTLAYNDGYLLYGLAYSAWRAVGMDPFLSAEMVAVTLRVVGFAGAYGFARGVLSLPFPWAAFGAAMFTLSLNAYQQSAHMQILSVALGPVAALLAIRTMRALEAGRPRAAVGWGAAFAVLAASWLLTAFYMAWLLAFYALLLAGIAAAVDPAMRHRAVATLRREWPAVAFIAVTCVVAVVPFLALYLPKARDTGMHDFAAVRPFLLTLCDTVRVGPGNLLFGWSDALLFPGRVGWSAERIVGWPPVFLACFAAATWSWRRWPAAGAAALAVCAVYLLTLSFGGRSGWWAVYQWVPGAKAIRVVSRAWIVLSLPMLCLVLAWLYQLGGGRPALAVVLAVLLVAEQLSSGPNVAALDRVAELRHLQSVLPAPAGCRAFAVLSARRDDPESDHVLQTNSANANAMLIAEVAGLPTVNGISTFSPRDWDAADPSSPDYVSRIAAYVRAHGLQDVCGLDLRTGRWYAGLGDYRAVHLVPTGGLLSLRGDGAGAEVLDAGWSQPFAWGRWSGARGSLRFLIQGDPGAVRLTAWAVVFPAPPVQTQRIAVLADGKLVATWVVSGAPAAYEAVLPATSGPFEVTFVNQDLDSTHDSGPGFGLMAIQVDKL
ncbi:MAG: hypothetical protein ACRYHQ_02940 [Janthinobacterium lividum]